MYINSACSPVPPQAGAECFGGRHPLLTKAIQPLDEAVSRFGASLKAKLSGQGVSGAPEDQLRAPFEQLLADLAELCSLPKPAVAAVGESFVSDLKTRPDYAVTVQERSSGSSRSRPPARAPTPASSRTSTTRRSGRSSSRSRTCSTPTATSSASGRTASWSGRVVRLDGDVETAGAKLNAPPEPAARCSTDFLRWEPIPPRDAKQLADVSARLCRLLRDEVTEQLAADSQALTGLADDWRKLLFPDATDERVRRRLRPGGHLRPAHGPRPGHPARRAASTRSPSELAQDQLAHRHRPPAPHRRRRQPGTLKTSLGTLTPRARRRRLADDQQGRPRRLALLLRGLPRGLRQRPPQADRLVLHAARSRRRDGPARRRGAPRAARFDLPAGLASPEVTVADPAVGHRHVPARRPAADRRDGRGRRGRRGRPRRHRRRRRPAHRVRASARPVRRRPAAHPRRDRRPDRATRRNDARPGCSSPTRSATRTTTRLDSRPSLAPIAESRRQANKIKREEPITVVIGNPPYKEKAKGTRRLGRSRDAPARGGPARRLDAAAGLGRRGAHASTCATCTSTSGAGPPGRCSDRARRRAPTARASSASSRSPAS